MSVQTQDITNDVKSGIRALWWLFLLRGVFGVVFGVLALVNGEAAVELLTFILGFYIILDGLLTIVAAIAERKRLGSIGWYIFQGVLSILIGAAIIGFSAAFAEVIGYLVYWAIVVISVLAGIVGLRVSFAARGVTKSWGWGVFVNALAILVGVLIAVLIFTNVEGLFRVLLVIIGIWSLLAGLAMVIWSFIARKYMNEAFKSLSVTQTTVN